MQINAYHYHTVGLSSVLVYRFSHLSYNSVTPEVSVEKILTHKSSDALETTYGSTIPVSCFSHLYLFMENSTINTKVLYLTVIETKDTI